MRDNVVLFTDTIQDLNGVSRFVQDMADYGKDDGFYAISSSSFENFPNKVNVINIKPFFEISMPFYKHMRLVFPKFSDVKKAYNRLKPKAIIISTPGFFGLMALFITRKNQNLKKLSIYHTDFPAYLYDNTKSKIIEKITICFMRLFYSKFDIVFTRSDEYRKNLIEVIGIEATKIRTLPSGINRENFNPNFKDENFYLGKFKALYVGRLSVEKNFDLLIRIWRDIHKKHPNALLLCCGEGKFMDEKESLKKDGIYLLGAKVGKELARVYASSDIFLFPSTTDTLGQVVMEAQSSGIPAIVSDKGGPRNLVLDDESGYILKANDEIWKEKILDIIDDEKSLERLKKGALTNSKNFDFIKSYEAIITLARL